MMPLSPLLANAKTQEQSQTRKVPKGQEDIHEILRRKFLARCRFRALVRRVIANLYWLLEDDEVYEGDNVQKRIEQAMRAKSKKTLLDLKDKALLNKPAEERTDQEKKYIYRKIGGLKCFKRYPNHVKKKLAAETYFVYYGPGRVIVRQHHEAHAMYFIVTGEVVVSITILDPILQKQMSINVFVMHPGDMFGEVSLLHNVKRTATCTTSGHCQFLALMKKDFKTVLQDSLQKQWDEVKQAMNSFTYFNGLDEVARREGCIVAKMKTFDPNEIIMGDGVGVPNFVYFVLSGDCQMIESLQISCTTVRGKKHFSLYDPYVREKTEEIIDFETKYFKNRKAKRSFESKASSEGTANDNADKQTIPVEDKAIDEKTAEENRTAENLSKVTERQPNVNALNDSSPIKNKTSEDTSGSNHHEIIESKSLTTDRTTSESKNNFRRSKDARVSIGICPTKEVPKEPPNLRTYFMQVCIFKPGSTFGFGENMRDRRIVAMTRVDCMLLPKIWLLQKNTANIWSRVQHYLEKKIPTKKQLFKEFAQQRRWLDWRNSIIEDVARRSKTVNHTTYHDVPYSIRMQETPDI